ncbi:MAG: hypothetical protein ABEJ70_04875 [Halobacteriaceae archaeon]
MTATVVLAEPLRDRDRRIECAEVTFVGDVLWATPTDSDRRLVVPTANVLGVEGDDVEQRVEEVPSRGGKFTEVVTDVS